MCANKSKLSICCFNCEQNLALRFLVAKEKRKSIQIKKKKRHLLKIYRIKGDQYRLELQIKHRSRGQGRSSEEGILQVL